jgi:hypothetical protein
MKRFPDPYAAFYETPFEPYASEYRKLTQRIGMKRHGHGSRRHGGDS